MEWSTNKVQLRHPNLVILTWKKSYYRYTIQTIAVLNKLNATLQNCQLFYSIPWNLQPVSIITVIAYYPISLINVFIRMMSNILLMILVRQYYYNW